MPSSTYDLQRFSLSDMTRCGIALRKSGDGATSMEAAANLAVRHLYENLVDPAGAPACTLVRTFITIPFASLPEPQQHKARSMMGDVPVPDGMKCLTLLATAGAEPAWNSRHSSVGHQALPLPSTDAIARSPMIAQLVRQLGVEIGSLVSPDTQLLLDAEQHTFNVFHVTEALGSPHIPAQESFVVPYGVRSVVGFGGVLPPGNLFATILFTNVEVGREVADLFRPLALSMKLTLLPFVTRQVFA